MGGRPGTGVVLVIQSRDHQYWSGRPLLNFNFADLYFLPLDCPALALGAEFTSKLAVAAPVELALFCIDRSNRVIFKCAEIHRRQAASPRVARFCTKYFCALKLSDGMGKFFVGPPAILPLGPFANLTLCLDISSLAMAQSPLFSARTDQLLSDDPRFYLCAFYQRCDHGRQHRLLRNLALPETVAKEIPKFPNRQSPKINDIADPK